MKNYGTYGSLSRPTDNRMFSHKRRALDPCLWSQVVSTHEVAPGEMRDMYTRIQGLNQDTCPWIEHKQLRENPLNCDYISHLKLIIFGFYNEYIVNIA